ncbi:MAG TPA: hypothetical protein VLG74_14250 [Blastocatellia bacterium]|nr:hypothetical protein [Blastocatellia bacterium]
MQTERTSLKATRFQRREAEIGPEVGFVGAEPDYIRDTICTALSSLPISQRALIRNRLLINLKKAGVKIRESLLMLGASAKTADELTAPEIAALIRYVRLTKPNVMTAIAEPLEELLAMTNRGVRVSGKAA